MYLLLLLLLLLLKLLLQLQSLMTYNRLALQCLTLRLVKRNLIKLKDP